MGCDLVVFVMLVGIWVFFVWECNAYYVEGKVFV